jgi:hypothetical protein
MGPWIEAGGEPDWRGTVVEVLRDARGLSGQELLALAEEHVGPGAPAKIALFHAFDIPISTLQAAWRAGPGARFDELLKPWI